MTTGMIQLIAGVLGVAFYGSIIWFSVRAKPLGAKPYRWATYIAITTGIVSLGLVLSFFTAIQNGRLGGAVFLAILAISCILCCVGLFRRRLYGAVMFHVAYILIFLTPAILAGIYGTRQTPQEAQQSGMFFIYYLITSWYIGKRWKILASPVDNSAPKVETAANQATSQN